MDERAGGSSSHDSGSSRGVVRSGREREGRMALSPANVGRVDGPLFLRKYEVGISGSRARRVGEGQLSILVE